MITPKDIETKDFSKTKGGGYRADEVDAFLDEILVDYSRLLEERNALKNKVNLLTEKLTALANTPAPAAPVSVPEPAPAAPAAPAEPTTAAAKQKAHRIVSDAEDYAKKLLETAQTEANRQNQAVEELSAQIEAFKKNLLDMYASHMDMIQKIPEANFSDARIGSETMDVLQHSFEEQSPAPTPESEAPAAQPSPLFDASELVEDAVPYTAPARTAAAPEATTVFTPYSEQEAAPRSRKSSGGLEELFEDDGRKETKKEKKKKKKLFFRDDDDEDDDFFDDEDE